MIPTGIQTQGLQYEGTGRNRSGGRSDGAAAGLPGGSANTHAVSEMREFST